MSKRYWIAAIALGLALSSPAWAAPPKQEAQQPQAATETQTGQQASATKDDSERPDYHLDSCYQSQSHNGADLCAQWRAAIAAEKAAESAHWANIIGGAGAILSFAGTLLVLIAIGLAYQANKIARESTAIDQRPWLDIQIPQMAFAIKGDKILGMIDVKATNRGKTPASDVVIDVKIINHWMQVNIKDAVKHLSELCIKHQAGHGAAVLPGGECGRSAITYTELGDVSFDKFYVGDISVLACVTYRLFGSGEIGQTGYVTTPSVVMRDPSTLQLYQRFAWQIVAEETGPGMFGYAT